jgi:hypothetical protein
LFQVLMRLCVFLWGVCVVGGVCHIQSENIWKEHVVSVQTGTGGAPIEAARCGGSVGLVVGRCGVGHYFIEE